MKIDRRKFLAASSSALVLAKSHDKQFRIPFIKQALATTGGRLNIFGSPWSPPAFMKDNNNMLHGGKLKPEFYQSWANYATSPRIQSRKRKMRTLAPVSTPKNRTIEK